MWILDLRFLQVVRDLFSYTTMSFCRFPQLRNLHSKGFHSSTYLKALNALALPKAEQISANWKGTSATGEPTKNFIGGEFVESQSTEWIDVHDPVNAPPPRPPFSNL